MGRRAYCERGQDRASQVTGTHPISPGFPHTHHFPALCQGLPRTTAPSHWPPTVASGASTQAQQPITPLCFPTAVVCRRRRQCKKLVSDIRFCEIVIADGAPGTNWPLRPTLAGLDGRRCSPTRVPRGAKALLAHVEPIKCTGNILVRPPASVPPRRCCTLAARVLLRPPGSGSPPARAAAPHLQSLIQTRRGCSGCHRFPDLRWRGTAAARRAAE